MHPRLLAVAFVTLVYGQVAAAEQVAGKVAAGGRPIAGSSVTLWAAGQGAPARLAETRTADDGAFRVEFDARKTGGGVDFPGWGLTIAGNGKVWVTSIGGKTIAVFDPSGSPISPPKTGYAGKGMQFLTGIVVDPAGNVWAANNIDLMDEVCLTKTPDESVSTRCGGNGFVVFFGLAKPVRTPVVGSQAKGW